MEFLKQRCQRREGDELCEFVSHAGPSAAAEGQEVFGFGEFTVTGDEPFGGEPAGLRPELGTHIEGVVI